MQYAGIEMLILPPKNVTQFFCYNIFFVIVWSIVRARFLYRRNVGASSQECYTVFSYNIYLFVIVVDCFRASFAPSLCRSGGGGVSVLLPCVVSVSARCKAAVRCVCSL